MRISKGLKQAYDLQDFTFQAALALKQSLTKEDGTLTVTRDDAMAIKQLVSAWESAQHRVAFHRKMPSPGSLRPQAKPARRGPRPSQVSPDFPPFEQTS
jgi:hypothetical protein